MARRKPQIEGEAPEKTQGCFVIQRIDLTVRRRARAAFDVRRIGVPKEHEDRHAARYKLSCAARTPAGCSPASPGEPLMIMNLERRVEITRAAVAAYERSIAEQADPIAVRRQQQCARVLQFALEALMMTDTELDAASSLEDSTTGGVDRVRADAIRGEISRRAGLTFHERMREAVERRRMREASPW